MKILLASMPADGHFNPLTGIAVHLRDRGHDVRWYAGPAYGSKIDRLDMPWFPYQRATEVMAGNLNRRRASSNKTSWPGFIIAHLQPAGDRSGRHH